MKKLPEYLKQNDYEKFYDELEKDINQSINELDLEIFGDIFGDINLKNKYDIINKKYFKLINDYELNQEMTKIIKEYFIPIDLKFHYENSKDDIFNIKESAFKEKDKDNEGKINKYEKKNKVKLCINIEQFIDKFPNLVKYQEIEKVDIFDIQVELQIPRQIRNYMDIIKNKLKDNKLNNIEMIINKIYDYIIENIYDKIYPIEPYEEDNNIYKKCVSLKWIQPDHCKDKFNNNFFMGNKENEMLEYLKLFDREKSFRKKFINIDKFIRLIPFFTKFPHYEESIDFLLFWMNYFFIKSQPLMMHSNKRFFELYNSNNTRKEMILCRLNDVSYGIPNVRYDYFNDISYEEFQKKCDDASKTV